MATVTLPPCPPTPNCVSTQAADALHAIAPIPYQGPMDEAMLRLLGVLTMTPGATITQRDDVSIRVQFRTRFFRFVDDAIFVLDDATKTIHFRSASRLGRRDFSVNRKRLETIREQFGK
jgi:uncharacterized protein (DUF1499 family)